MAIQPTPNPPPTTTTINIAILNCLTPIPSILSSHGPFSTIFLSLLQSAATRITTKHSPHQTINITGTTFNTLNGEYPDNLEDFNALLITGSFASAYDKDEWVLRLIDYIKEVYNKHPSIKIFGSCFGHQIIAQSLLTPIGGFVEKNPSGYEIGIQEINLSEIFTSHFPRQFPMTPKKSPNCVQPQSMKLQFIHADHVVLPPSSKSLGWKGMNIGSTKGCTVQGLYEPGRLLSYQGHFEFSGDVNREVVKAYGGVAGWGIEMMEGMLGMLGMLGGVEGEDDAGVAAEVVVEFLLE